MPDLPLSQFGDRLSGHWTVVIEAASAVDAQMVREALDAVYGVETVAISFDADDAARLLGVEPETLVVDVRAKGVSRTSDDDLVKLCQADATYRQEYVEELKRRGWAESHPDDDYDPEDER